MCCCTLTIPLPRKQWKMIRKDVSVVLPVKQKPNEFQRRFFDYSTNRLLLQLLNLDKFELFI